MLNRIKRYLPIIATALVTGAIAVIGSIAFWRRHRLAQHTPHPAASDPEAFEALQGLSEAEAHRRHNPATQNTLGQPETPLKGLIRRNSLNIFNINLVMLSLVQVMIGRYFDAVMSFGVMLINIAVQTGQELFARHQLAQVVAKTAPQSTIIRQGAIRTIDPNQVVYGDILIVGPGDQILVDGKIIGDGQLTVDESLLNKDATPQVKLKRDTLLAGSYILNGRAAYRAEKIGNQRVIATKFKNQPLPTEQSTQLETLIINLMRVLLIIVMLIGVLSVIQYFRLDLPIPKEVYNDAVSVVFGVVPSGLFLMILLTYVAGTVDLSKLGALVKQARTVESMAEVEVICFAQAGILTGTNADFEMLPSPDPDHPAPTNSRTRQILGDFARSIHTQDAAIKALQNSFEGNSRPSTEIMPLFNVYGWYGLTFSETDLNGLYILGEPDVLQPYLQEAPPESTPGDDSERETAFNDTVKKQFGRVGGSLSRLFRRNKADASSSPPHADPETTAPDETAIISPEHPATRDIESKAEPANNFNIRQSFSMLGRLWRNDDDNASPAQSETDQADAADVQTSQETTLLLVWHPATTSLFNTAGHPVLPDGLLPLCQLSFSQTVDPTAAETIHQLQEDGVTVKIFTNADISDLKANIEPQVEDPDVEAPDAVEIDGERLGQLQGAALRQAIVETKYFSKITPDQMAQIVGGLKLTGRKVAVVGDSVNDLPALRQANLAIARSSSSQAAMTTADILLLESSPQVLVKIIDKGQRIVRGLLDVLRLYLTQVFYLFLLILILRWLKVGFPYKGAQGGIIAALTLEAPAILLSLIAAAGALRAASYRSILARFVVPSAISISVITAAIYVWFERLGYTVAETQLITTHTLIGIGLLLVLFIKPPFYLSPNKRAAWGDWRPTALAIVLAVGFLIATLIPLVQETMFIAPLHRPIDYAIVAGVVLGWGIINWLALQIWDWLRPHHSLLMTAR